MNTRIDTKVTPRNIASAILRIYIRRFKKVLPKSYLLVYPAILYKYQTDKRFRTVVDEANTTCHKIAKKITDYDA